MVDPVKKVLEGRKKVLNEKKLKAKLAKKKAYAWREKKRLDVSEGVAKTDKYTEKIL